MANPTLCLLSARRWHQHVHVALRGASDGARECESARVVVRGASLLGWGHLGRLRLTAPLGAVRGARTQQRDACVFDCFQASSWERRTAARPL